MFFVNQDLIHLYLVSNDTMKKDLKSQQTKNEICVEICVHTNTNSKRLEYKNIFVFFPQQVGVKT